MSDPVDPVRQHHAQEMETVQRLACLADLFYRRWRFEQAQPDLTMRLSWERLKARLLPLPADQFDQLLARYVAAAERRTVAAANLWRPVSYTVEVPTSLDH